MRLSLAPCSGRGCYCCCCCCCYCCCCRARRELLLSSCPGLRPQGSERSVGCARGVLSPSPSDHAFEGLSVCTQPGDTCPRVDQQSASWVKEDGPHAAAKARGVAGEEGGRESCEGIQGAPPTLGAHHAAPAACHVPSMNQAYVAAVTGHRLVAPP